MREHIDRCADCAWILVVLEEIVDLEQAGSLPTLTSVEKDAMRASLRFQDPKSRWESPFGSALLGGVGGMLTSMLEHGDGFQPALARSDDGEKTHGLPVRDPDQHASEEMQAGNGHGTSLQEDSMSELGSHSPEVDPAKSEWSSPFDQILSAHEDNASAMKEPDPVSSTPIQDAGDWAGQQHGVDTCAIRCQEYLITQFTGQDPGEAALVTDASAHGWYQEGGGTAPEDVGNLLEERGIAVNRYQHANIFNLANELAQGHKVIVGVHADDLWRQHPILDQISEKLGLNQADHAVVVSGIDTSDPRHVQVIVSDPGTGQAVAHYPMDQFVHAWKDSDFFMVATQDPPPPASHLPEMAHFDYGQGHIDHVWGMDFDDFQSIAEHPDAWEHPEPPGPAPFDDGGHDEEGGLIDDGSGESHDCPETPSAPDHHHGFGEFDDTMTDDFGHHE